MLDKSCLNKSCRTKHILCPPLFSLFEWGYNQNANRLIRCILPKKIRFGFLSQKDISRHAEWMNRYSRRLFNGKSARQIARKETLRFIRTAACFKGKSLSVAHLFLQFTYRCRKWVKESLWFAFIKRDNLFFPNQTCSHDEVGDQFGCVGQELADICGEGEGEDSICLDGRAAFHC